jgi:hypothetical protein
VIGVARIARLMPPAPPAGLPDPDPPPSGEAMTLMDGTTPWTLMDGATPLETMS